MIRANPAAVAALLGDVALFDAGALGRMTAQAKIAFAVGTAVAKHRKLRAIEALSAATAAAPETAAAEATATPASATILTGAPGVAGCSGDVCAAAATTSAAAATRVARTFAARSGGRAPVTATARAERQQINRIGAAARHACAYGEHAPEEQRAGRAKPNDPGHGLRRLTRGQDRSEPPVTQTP